MKFEAISIQPGFSEYIENMRYIRVYSEYTMDNYDEIDLLSTVFPILETSEYNLFKEALEFANSILDRIESSKINLSMLKVCALFEVLRRLFIITDLNIIEKKTAWNKVLGIQLAAIKEIPIIFKRF